MRTRFDPLFLPPMPRHYMALTPREELERVARTHSGLRDEVSRVVPLESARRQHRIELLTFALARIGEDSPVLTHRLLSLLPELGTLDINALEHLAYEIAPNLASWVTRSPALGERLLPLIRSSTVRLALRIFEDAPLQSPSTVDALLGMMTNAQLELRVRELLDVTLYLVDRAFRTGALAPEDADPLLSALAACTTSEEVVHFLQGPLFAALVARGQGKGEEGWQQLLVRALAPPLVGQRGLEVLRHRMDQLAIDWSQPHDFVFGLAYAVNLLYVPDPVAAVVPGRYHLRHLTQSISAGMYPFDMAGYSPGKDRAVGSTFGLSSELGHVLQHRLGDWSGVPNGEVVDRLNAMMHERSWTTSPEELSASARWIREVSTFARALWTASLAPGGEALSQWLATRADGPSPATLTGLDWYVLGEEALRELPEQLLPPDLHLPERDPAVSEDALLDLSGVLALTLTGRLGLYLGPLKGYRELAGQDEHFLAERASMDLALALALAFAEQERGTAHWHLFPWVLGRSMDWFMRSVSSNGTPPDEWAAAISDQLMKDWIAEADAT